MHVCVDGQSLVNPLTAELLTWRSCCYAQDFDLEFKTGAFPVHFYVPNDYVYPLCTQHASYKAITRSKLSTARRHNDLLCGSSVRQYMQVSVAFTYTAQFTKANAVSMDST